MGWTHKKQITISGSSGAGEGYQVLLKIGESSGSAGCDFHLEGHSAKFPTDKGDGGDLRFSSADGETLLPFWVEKVEGSSPNRIAYVWVKVYDNLDSDVDIWVFYGNSEANNDSDIDKTFLIGDDFDGDDIDTNKWTFICGNKGNGNYSVSNSILTWTDLPFGIKCSHSSLQSALLRAKYYQLNPTMYGSGLIWRNDTYGDKRLFRIWRDSGDWIWLYDTSQNKYDVANNFTSWGILELVKDQNDNIKVYLNGEQQGGSYINTYALESVSLGNDGYSGSLNTSDFKFDWIFVRKYIDTEPSFYTAGTEQDAGNISFEFTYFYIDELVGAYGFTELNIGESLVVPTGFYMEMSSFVDSVLSIETCRIRNKAKYSVDLVGRIISAENNSSVNVYFEYWRKDSPADVISTSVQTITDFTQPAYVFQTIAGLDEVTDYEYRAVIYVDENDKKYGGVVPFTTAGIRNVEIEQTVGFVENQSHLFLSSLYENLGVGDSYRLWDIWSVKSYENIGIKEDDLKFLYMYYFEENIGGLDEYKNLFLSEFEERMRIYGNQRYGEPYPVKWIVTTPANTNFSFEKDTNSDGIADNWQYENLVLSDCFVSNYFTKPTVQFVKFGNGGRFYTEWDVETEQIVVCMDIAIEGEISFKVYDKNTGKIFYHKKYKDKGFENEVIKFNTRCPLVFEFYGDNSSLYLDNFAILTDKELKNRLTGFSVFRYNIKGEDTDITFVRQYLKQGIVKKDFTLGWNWLPRSEFEIAKNMKGKQIYVRTPLNESFAFYVYGIESDMTNIKSNQEWEQKYQTVLSVKEA